MTQNGGGMTRRSFLVMAGTLVLGTFMMPRADFLAKRTKTRRLIVPPVRWGPEQRWLVWSEFTQFDEPEIFVWQPETPDETAEAERFMEAVDRINWDDIGIHEVQS